MTMAEYKDILFKNIPSPLNIQQAMLDKYASAINKQLKEKGEAHICTNEEVGNRKVLIATARSLKKMYEGAGYKVFLNEYANSNKNVFYMHIEISLDI